MIHYPYMLNELKFFPKVKLINAKGLGGKILSLPISEEHSKNEIYYIIKIIKNFFKKKLNENYSHRIYRFYRVSFS